MQSTHTPRNFTLSGSSHLNIQQGQAAKNQIKKTERQKTCTMCHLLNDCPPFKLEFSHKRSLGPEANSPSDTEQVAGRNKSMDFCHKFFFLPVLKVL